MFQLTIAVVSDQFYLYTVVLSAVNLQVFCCSVPTVVNNPSSAEVSMVLASLLLLASCAVPVVSCVAFEPAVRFFLTDVVSSL
jgi:hypothetical protein